MFGAIHYRTGSYRNKDLFAFSDLGFISCQLMISAFNQGFVASVNLQVANCLATILCESLVQINLHFSTRNFIASLSHVAVYFQEESSFEVHGNRSDEFDFWLNAVEDSKMVSLTLQRGLHANSKTDSRMSLSSSDRDLPFSRLKLL
ncbi:hypothetical protein AVEN_98803-1 [Araneus ventricosus]|uniref:Uncharacterized protein n=1 Tax=Araneus ventricosus TaxID=182803 RepID=A0A4Y2VVY7_ARAVE|nr:hypothetical protein AVEN_98803-1 [Araneus ventricosus]